MKKIKAKAPIICAIIAISTLLILGITHKKTTSSKITYDELDMTTTWNESEATLITLETNKNVNITTGGTYVISGTSTNSNITINTEDEVVLILNNVNLTNKTGPAIIVENAKKTVITLNENTTNTLSDGESYSNQEYDAVIYSKDDLTINGDGSLEINANYENAIKSKDDLKIISGNITITSKTNGIIGKDSVTIKSGNINITAGEDGIKSNNDTDEGKGNIIIEDANITIKSQEDGIQAENDLIINDGVFDIKTGNGSSELSPKQGWENSYNTSNEISKKAIKATNITINNGTFTIDSEEDGIHSNGNLTINNGTYTMKSNDDGIHGDALVEINDGTFEITASEGIEATFIKINGGNITIDASDDGINAGKKSNEYTPTIEINGGNITIKMGSGDTDGLDSNGNLYINGGTIDITCNSPFDYDGEAKYTGGKMIVNGEETTEITNQMMGGPGMMQGGMPNPGQKNMQGVR